ncbi:CobW family GTP-binding protein [Oribacterium sp. oral taxon 108]|uniref:CobW family GTP-binding protein n=1 Tax=Oribacterium sp. oral taxon 108 TaxID=712414 RepID=UPI00020DD766|nr:CobW family GTP-binding protein [Oribacterium sp. oral taxon 108]EGL37565.1 CobW/P47K family protein [Oribacterium sp. oral taxon 108 str. F0425]
MTQIDIISGFLGAGKTTFIQKLLQESLKGENVVLIENEFGEIGIDSGFLKNSGIEIREMNQGCICCSLVGDFETSLKEVIETYKPDRILIEPSGVGKLSDILSAVKTVSANLPVHLDGAVTVVDSTKAKLYNKNFGEFFDDQIRYATSIVLSRTDIATEEKVEEAIRIVRALNPKANLITTAIKELSGEKLLEIIGQEENLEEALLQEVKEKAHHHEHHHHGHEHHHDEHCHCHHEEEEQEHHHEHHFGNEEEHCCCCGGAYDDEDEEESLEHEHHDEHCACSHDHEHEHHDDHCSCGHEHHDHHDHEHHHHGEHCSCGHDHDADEIFDSIGVEVFKKVSRARLAEILEEMAEGSSYGGIVRAKGMLQLEDGKWVNFDMVPEQVEIRDGEPENIGKFVVIGTELEKEKIKALFTA